MTRDQEDASSLGERVRKRRKELGLTAKVVARAAGVSSSYISQLERGRQQDPSLPTLRRLADALAMDLLALMGAKASAEGPAPIPAGLRTLAETHQLPEDTVAMLAGIHVDGRRPSTTEDWLFLLLAVRHACGIAATSASQAEQVDGAGSTT
jgi:transcriptional regulator with XRE-family HTH domain